MGPKSSMKAVIKSGGKTSPPNAKLSSKTSSSSQAFSTGKNAVARAKVSMKSVVSSAKAAGRTSASLRRAATPFTVESSCASLGPISYFSGSAGLLEKQLGNFYPSVIKVGTRKFPTAEHAFHAYKAADAGPTADYKAKCKRFRDYFTIGKPEYIGDNPGMAKKTGGKNGAMKHLGITLRADWDSKRLDVMRNILRAKFIGPAKITSGATKSSAVAGTKGFKHLQALQKALLSTGKRQLLHAGFRIDTFWGCKVGGNKLLKGENWHGRILMEIRKELRKNQK